MKTVKFCKDCKWSFPDKTSSWELRCKCPAVNAKDSWALGNIDFTGSSCRVERNIKFFAPCGMKGKLWEAAK